MKRRNIARKDLFAGCAEPGPGDGLDPRLELRQEPGKVANRKALLLCGEAERTLSAILSGESGGAVLRNLVVASVKPAPTSARLLVSVYPAVPLEGVDPDAILGSLERARGWLRTEVASALHRRRAPDLMFRVVDAR
ncbi:MAG TPA: hypothetical protein VMS17_06110 [Gemmataceae bacterium]|nr:hypothetical protein [Gemmataceae bacterium]